MLKVVKDAFHLRLMTSNGAGFSIPIEVVKGIQEETIDDRRYWQAAEFLSGEGQENISVQMIRDICEANI